MKRELEDELYQLCPNLYSDKDFYGIGVGVGWYSLIKELSLELEKLILQYPFEERKRYHVLQVKEKFGRLSFYVSHSCAEMNKLIQDAGEKSASICEVCGNVGKDTYDLGWIKTRCEEHSYSRI